MTSGWRYEVDIQRLRVPGAVLLGGGLLFAHLPSDWGVPCPLRTLTGVPCPFCGLTTSVRNALGGHIYQAFDAAPLGLLVIIASVAVLLRGTPKTLRIAPPVALVALVTEWVFELHRFGLL
ncbi:MAG TPA: DUF2752 domain-containing protein [Acidimicrobiales bacterium]|nr:DUF2752 domain-containing protein [Acidimicrobiales bacterium]